MDDMYHTCRWCKHFSKEDDRCCKNFFYIVMDIEYFHNLEKCYSSPEIKDFDVCIKDPDNFYCKEWE